MNIGCKIGIFFTLACLTFGAYTPSWAATGSVSEEQQCFTKLNENVKNDTRFTNSQVTDILPNKDLSKTLFDEKKGSYLDLTKYDTFREFASKNPNFDKNNTHGFIDTDYLMRRTHIGTVIGGNNFIISTILGFGKDSNFTFPLTSKTGNPFGDPYKLYGGTFKEFLLYTHHSITGDFLSCGIIKITPLGGRTFGEVSESGYFTNILNGVASQSSLNGAKCSSGFEGAYTVASDSKKYYSMKSNICVLDYAQKDFVKMELVSVAYDNNSPYFNEYLVLPLQVQAMRDTDIRSGGLVEIRDTFGSYLMNKTCQQFFHPRISDLPATCQGKYSSKLLAIQTPHAPVNSVSNISHGGFLSFIIENTYAARQFNFTEEEINNTTGMVAYENVPYALYMKMLKINNKTFKDFLRMSLSNTFEEYILARKEQGILISPYEETFLKCAIPYAEREKIVIDFLEKLPDPNNIELNNLTYSNPKFGDCIIPYPDKENLNKVIPDSFASNQLLAQQLSGEYKGPEVSENMKKILQEQNTLNLKYQQKIDSFTQDFNKGIITGEELKKKIEEEKAFLEKSTQEIFAKDVISTEVNDNSQKIDTGGIVTSTNSQSMNTTNIIFGVLLLGLGLGIFLIRLRKTKK